MVGLVHIRDVRHTHPDRKARELRWRGKLLVRGLFDGEYVFELQSSDTGTTFVHYEQFSGLLVPLFKGMLERDTRPGFEAMNEALQGSNVSDTDGAVEAPYMAFVDASSSAPASLLDAMTSDAAVSAKDGGTLQIRDAGDDGGTTSQELARSTPRAAFDVLVLHGSPKHCRIGGDVRSEL